MRTVFRYALLPTAMVCVAASSVFSQVPLPLDPLTNAERAIADTIARADSGVRAILRSGPAQLVRIEFIAAKTGGDATADVPARRHAEVLFYLEGQDAGVAALVDLAARRVVDLVRISGQSVPLSVAEVERATTLALATPSVVNLFAGAMPAFRLERAAVGVDTASTRIDGIRTTGPPGDPCYRRRCVVLLFRVNNRYVHLNRVVVDLLSNRVFIREGGR